MQAVELLPDGEHHCMPVSKFILPPRQLAPWGASYPGGKLNLDTGGQAVQGGKINCYTGSEGSGQTVWMCKVIWGLHWSPL